MPSQGPLSGNSFTSATWANPSNAAASDNAYSTATNGTLEVSDFGFSIPGSAVIDGVQIDVEGKTDGNSKTVFCGAAVSSGSAEKTISWNASEMYRSYGGVSDTWGLPFTPANINASFKANIRISSGATVVSVDHVRVTVYYTGASGYSFAQVMG